MTEARRIDHWAWSPQVGPQYLAIAAAPWVDELFFGGARGGGKTDFLLGDFAQDLDQGSAWRGVMFRRSHPEMDEVVRRSLEIYPATGGEWKAGAREWRWPNGARLSLRHLDNDADVAHYQGHSYAWIAFDELPNWPNLYAYKALVACLRGPAEHKRIRSTGNPGGRCHTEVKEHFQIGAYPQGHEPIEDEASGMTRMFIPSRVQDNKVLLSTDPGYVDRLNAVGDNELVRAWLDGDWDAVVGSYFSMFRRADVECDPFNIPTGWSLFGCMDYGEENPSWFGLLAVDYDDDVYVIDEYYRAGAGGAEHARAIKELVEQCPFIGSRKPKLYLAPHDMWTKRKPGEASQALAPQDAFVKEGIHLTRANMERVNGWRNIKDLMYGKRLRCFRGRTERLLGSLSSVQRDPHNPEDVLKGGDDHPADGLRYGINHVYRPREKGRRNIPEGQQLLETLEQMAKGKGGRYD